MKQLLYMLTAFTCLTTACESVTDSTSRLVPEPDILERLDYQKREIDTLFKHQKNKLIVLAKIQEQEELVLINDVNFPENVELTFNILKDSLGKVITVSAFPHSESGDWNISLTHYFDKKGKTFALERQTSFYNSNCTEGLAYETKTEFYDSGFQLIGNRYKLIDEKYKNLNKDSCILNYDFEYKVEPTVDKFLQINRIKNSI